MNIVIDTNIIASAVFFGGKPKKLLEMVLNGNFSVYATKEIIEEYKQTFEYLLNKYKNNTLQIPLLQIILKTKLIDSNAEIHICRDPDDDKFISCAKDANCIYIISGDKDLLSLENYEGIKIVTVAEFFDLIGA